MSDFSFIKIVCAPGHYFNIDRLGIWVRKWGMKFQPVKCNMMQLTYKHNKIQPSYTLDGTVLENVESIKYFGVTITSDLRWNDCSSLITEKDHLNS